MRNYVSIRTVGIALTGLLAIASIAQAHHNSQAEFGPFGSSTIYVEGKIVNINWANPHISIDIETTGGAITAGEKWRLVSHPIRIMEEYGFAREDFAVGDSVKLHTWTHVRKQPLLWPRAIQVNDGPMRSNLRFTDMIDIAKGTFEAMNIVAPLNLNGSPPERAGADTVEKLRAMGLLGVDGRMIWPPPAGGDGSVR
jgi:hypothetical protein